ncbi:hypothetical protein CKA32_006673 [Geitlerinema sp. FC II]|nr:hypothetical protein CKA32_006673 [Geitlerinema sp. FC II]
MLNDYFIKNYCFHYRGVDRSQSAQGRDLGRGRSKICFIS